MQNFQLTLSAREFAVSVVCSGVQAEYATLKAIDTEMKMQVRGIIGIIGGEEMETLGCLLS
jgi:hypothetical protein